MGRIALVPQRLDHARRDGERPIGDLRRDIGLGFAQRGGGFGKQRFEAREGLDLGGQFVRVVRRQAQLLDIAAALGIGQFGQAGAAFVQKALIEFEWQQVRVGEIAVVVRVLFRTHRAGRAGIGIKQPRFLHDLATILDQIDLAADLVLDRLHDEAHRIDVLGFGPRAQLGIADLAHADIDVGPHRALFHVAVARSDIAQDRAQLPDIGPGLRR